MENGKFLIPALSIVNFPFSIFQTMSEHFISRDQAGSDLLSAAAFIAENIKSADGHAEAMKAIVLLYLAKDDVDLAAELANGVGEPFSRDKLLILVAEKCAQADDDEYALQLADAIEDHGLQAQAFERIALEKASKGQLSEAREVGNSLVHPDFVHGGIAVKQAEDGDDAAALATIDSIDFASARVAALHEIASAKIESGNTAKAADLLDTAVQSAKDIEHDEEKIRALCDTGNLFIEAKRSDKAVETFDTACKFAEVLDNIHRDFFFVNCALGFLYAGSDELADRTLDLVTDKTQMASALLGFARESWKKGEKADAVETLDEAFEILKSQREIETRDSRARNGLIATIAVQFVGFGKTERGLEAAEENKDIDEQMGALSQIAHILTIQKDDEMARQTLNMIPDDTGRLFALISVADAKEKLGETDAAVAFLEEAATLAETVPQLGLRSDALNEIAARFADHGQTESARKFLLESLLVISEIRDESSQAAALAGLSTIYGRVGIEIGDAERSIIGRILRKIGW